MVNNFVTLPMEICHRFFELKDRPEFQPSVYCETGIKRVKFHFKRVQDETLLSSEEFSTLLTQIDAWVNFACSVTTLHQLKT